jgi:predicted NACHT family NTPase
MVELASLSISLAKAIAPSAKGFLQKVGKEQYDRFIATYTNVFSDHVRATEARCSSIKTILHRDDPISLASQYVELHFEVGAQEVTDEDVVNYALTPGNALLVSGLAGSGKSMFMKWAALRLIEMIPQSQRIPLFIEIREVPSEKLELPFDQIIFEMSSSERSKATFEQFYVGLTEGQFLVMIDGLDEVPVRNRDAILNEITDFRRRFPRASLLCSSRPDRQLESSNALRIYHVKDMTLDQVCQVIDNALFDQAKKTAFIDALRGGLYRQHVSFMSNPLLATIMLITYDVGTGVPNKLSLFYSQVYEALFFKHDSSKGVYVREHHSHLDIDQFEVAFRTLCFQSYAMSKIYRSNLLN